MDVDLLIYKHWEKKQRHWLETLRSFEIINEKTEYFILMIICKIIYNRSSILWTHETTIFPHPIL